MDFLVDMSVADWFALIFGVAFLYATSVYEPAQREL